MDIDIEEGQFGIANRLNLFINNKVLALDWCKNVFFLNIFRTNGWILLKFCLCIDVYKIHVVSKACYFCRFLTELWPLINVRILFMLNILWINLWISIKFCICIDNKGADQTAWILCRFSHDMAHLVKPHCSNLRITIGNSSGISLLFNFIVFSLELYVVYFSYRKW